ncbi:hypothetical protein [Cellulomonas fimi]|uniref:Serine-threonine protein kinase n=1 Tax=Cellulomonas fimi TaxID=1708 RepID=A0A7Y0LUY4_CELFI|nr:hypothetical protein [Cellulomonas fimi]NMR18686.1 hypothetical protein [Cellulomonas fimi]
MGRETTPGGTEYHLVAFDAAGVERPELGVAYSEKALQDAAASAPTDVFLMSHGWNGDVPAARAQYDRWIDAMAACTQDLEAARARPGGFRGLIVAVHWPSKAWGDEDLGDASFGLPGPDLPGPDLPGADPAAALAAPSDALLESALEAFGSSPEAHEALLTIVRAAMDDAAPVTLPDEVREAYRRLDAASGVGAEGEGASPAEDRAPFDAETAYQACLLDELVSFGGMSLGGVLAPLRILTFWQMKRRAADVGSTGIARLLTDLQGAAPTARFHLMGHSFGCIVVSASLAGAAGAAAGAGSERTPVHSLTLVQGAMSHWSFCRSIPSAPARAGWFHRVVADGLVAGPTVVTTSVHDRAVRVFYPLGAGARGQVDYGRVDYGQVDHGPGDLPTYGAIGTFGIRGPGIAIVDDDLHAADQPYALRPGIVHNLRADDVISEYQGAMGAHSDIAKEPVAHAMWQAALT